MDNKDIKIQTWENIVLKLEEEIAQYKEELKQRNTCACGELLPTECSQCRKNYDNFGK